MDLDRTLASARDGLTRVGPQFADLLGRTTDLQLPVPGSTWSVLETAVHVAIVVDLYGDLPTGVESPWRYGCPDELAQLWAARLADFPESRPNRLADLLRRRIDRLLAVTAARAGRETVAFHNGRTLPLAVVVASALGEVLVHGADVAAAVDLPWAPAAGDCAAAATDPSALAASPAAVRSVAELRLWWQAQPLLAGGCGR